MNWPRVKTILIFLFLAVDIILLASIIFPQISISKIPVETINNTAEVLSSRGIEISSEIIPAKRQSLGTVELYSLWPDKNVLAKKLLEETPSYDGHAFKTDSETITFSESEFHYISLDLEKTLPHQLLGLGIDLRKHLYEQGDSTYRIWQTINDKKFFESEVYAVSDDSSVTLSGYWIFSDRENGVIINTPDTLTDVTGVLINFINNPLREDKVKITSVETGYSSGTAYRDTEHKLVSLVPAYKISTDNGAYYMYDALSGLFLYANKNGEIIY